MPQHRNLNLKKFIDSIPESLIEEYFQRRFRGKLPASLTAFDYGTIKSFLDDMEDEELQRSILEDFTHINDICEKMMNILVKAVHRYEIDVTGEEQKQELAMRIFLHHLEAYEYAYDYYCLFNSTSKMSDHNITAGDFKITHKKIDRFKDRVIQFYSDLLKGRECRVRHYDDKDETIIVVMHGSYKRSLSVWRGQMVKTFFIRPANEDILRFNKQTSVLSIKAPYRKDKENYIKAFTEAIIGDESQAERPDRDVTYTLEPLQKGTFSFDGNENIRAITLLEVKLAMRGVGAPTMTISSDDILRTFQNDLYGVDLKSGDIVHAKFKFMLDVDGKRKGVTFEVTPPNVTDLTKKRHADIIGDYLKENGVKLV